MADGLKNAKLARRFGQGSARMVRPLVAGGALLAVVGLAGYGLVALLRDSLIVAFGIALIDLTGAVFLYGVLPLGAVLLATAGGRALYGRVKESKGNLAAGTVSKLRLTAAAITPETVRSAFEELAPGNPDLLAHIDDALTQMDEMDIKQARLQRLIKMNDVNYLNNVVMSLDEVEQYLCVNFLRAINRVIVNNNAADTSLIRLFTTVLEENRRQLDNTQRLLDDAADWVSGNSPKSSLESVRALQEVIHEQLRQLEEVGKL
jgi:hypothetical protein